MGNFVRFRVLVLMGVAALTISLSPAARAANSVTDVYLQNGSVSVNGVILNEQGPNYAHVDGSRHVTTSKKNVASRFEEFGGFTTEVFVGGNAFDRGGSADIDRKTSQGREYVTTLGLSSEEDNNYGKFDQNGWLVRSSRIPWFGERANKEFVERRVSLPGENTLAGEVDEALGLKLIGEQTKKESIQRQREEEANSLAETTLDAKRDQQRACSDTVVRVQDNQTAFHLENRKDC